MVNYYIVFENLSENRINFGEGRLTFDHLRSDPMDIDKTPMEIVLWINVGLPSINQFSILEYSYPDLAYGGLIGISSFDIEGVESSHFW